MRLISTAAFALIVVTGVARHATAQDPHRKYPSLPGAVKSPPAWLGKDVPFDVASYFGEIPPRQNAAPLYLDAFFEFGAEMACCFPAGPETDARSAAARERSQRLEPLLGEFNQDRASVDRAAMRTVLEGYETGFQKLAQAQKRPQCVFENGIGIMSLLPHVQLCRRVTRIASLRALASIERGDFTAPVDDIARVLRMTRDIQARGPVITQQVYAAMVAVTAKDVVIPVLSSPRLRGTQCNRLIKVLTDHEARALDGYSEGAKAEYLMARSTLFDLAGRPGDRDRAAADKAKADLVRDALPMLEQMAKDAPKKAQTKEIVADLSNATQKQFDDAVADCNAYYRDLLALANLPYAEKQVKLLTVGQGSRVGSSSPVEFARLLRFDAAIVIEALARAEANLHGLECLAAVRRFQITHKTLPRNLSAACREAGLKAVPTDPYSGQPLKFAVQDGQPVVYSVGKDGKDDGGKLDSKNNTQPGDLIFRLDRAD
jgi:hypothetical protein